MSDDICDRLVRFSKQKQCMSTDLEVEAADEIERLREENARLRAALKPFVPKTQVINAAIPDTRPIDVMVRAGELRAAAAALKETGNE